MTNISPGYEPRYYERSAQRYLAQRLETRLSINVPWGLSGTPASRPEIDAVAVADRHVIPIEIKAYTLDVSDVEDIVAKYKLLGLRQLIVVSPGTSDRAARWVAHEPFVKELMVFRPPIAEISEWYEHTWPQHVPSWVQVALSSGHHHVRFVLSRPTSRGHFVVGQQRSRVYGVETIGRLLRRLPSPVVRVLWTPLRFSIPRDVLARKSRLTSLGGFVPVDIDGDRLHRALHACELAPGEGVCQFCLRYAKREQERLFEQMEATPVDVVASGGRGVHVYYYDDGRIRSKLLDLAHLRAIRIDESVTACPKATVAMPGSLHAGSMEPVVSTMRRQEG